MSKKRYGSAAEKQAAYRARRKEKGKNVVGGGGGGLSSLGEESKSEAEGLRTEMAHSKEAREDAERDIVDWLREKAEERIVRAEDGFFTVGGCFRFKK
jgi:hypothetical protein